MTRIRKVKHQKTNVTRRNERIRIERHDLVRARKNIQMIGTGEIVFEGQDRPIVMVIPSPLAETRRMRGTDEPGFVEQGHLIAMVAPNHQTKTNEREKVRMSDKIGKLFA